MTSLKYVQCMKCSAARASHLVLLVGNDCARKSTAFVLVTDLNAHVVTIFVGRDDHQVINLVYLSLQLPTEILDLFGVKLHHFVFGIIRMKGHVVSGNGKR